MVVLKYAKMTCKGISKLLKIKSSWNLSYKPWNNSIKKFQNFENFCENIFKNIFPK